MLYSLAKIVWQDMICWHMFVTSKCSCPMFFEALIPYPTLNSIFGAISGCSWSFLAEKIESFIRADLAVKADFGL